MIKAGIIGGAGYTAGELLRLLINHPGVEVAWIPSTSNAGAPVADIHEGLIGETDMTFAADYDLSEVDVVFLCQGHGFSARFWQENPMPEGLKVVDLAQDFRDESEGYVYGLPEASRPAISAASKVANPGCFATAIQLALLPLAAAGKLDGEIHITGITGSTGAGVKPGATTHFSWRNNNISVYKPFAHQHAGVRPDIITCAKGIANGFPMGAVIISPSIEAKKGMLGTTFGGNHLACAAAVAVLDVMKDEHLVENAAEVGQYLIDRLTEMASRNPEITEVRGRGLMIGIEIKGSAAALRRRLLFEGRIFTGGAGEHTVRLLPALGITRGQADTFLNTFEKFLQ